MAESTQHTKEELLKKIGSQSKDDLVSALGDKLTKDELTSLLGSRLKKEELASIAEGSDDQTKECGWSIVARRVTAPPAAARTSMSRPTA